MFTLEFLSHWRIVREDMQHSHCCLLVRECLVLS